ncbi:MAG: DMT family transporter [Lentimicrobiaceae bacterium]|jgi:drug/metabolite transporter (DMT)-like permease|nr:DMT family transporter [Lentimicrobiaceae bacterium]
MAYLYLTLAVFFTALVFIVFRLFSKYRIDNFQAIAVNYAVAAIVCFLIFDEGVSFEKIVESDWFFMTFAIGLGFVIGYFLYALSSQRVGVAVTAVSSQMSVMIPVGAGFVLFGDQLTQLKVAGILLTLVALYLILKKDRNKVENTIKTPNKLMTLLPVSIFLLTGLNDIMMKYTETHFVKNDLLLMLSTVFVAGFLFSLVFLSVNIVKGTNKFAFRNLVAGLVLGCANFLSTYFLFRSMSFFQASLLFPIRNIGVVCISALAGIFIFNEKLSRTNRIGIAIAAASILIISL